jgi:NAD(P)-dependent dehydrogenase (short-subunit alcohol dehydrogenase family)
MAFAVVTGANRGLGLEVSRQLLRRGFDVRLTAREATAGTQAVRELGSLGWVRASTLDVTDPATVERLAEELAASPPIDAIVNNAGTSLTGFDADVVRQTLDTNYRGAVRVTNALRSKLSPTANIVMVSSGMGELSHLGPDLRARFLDPALDRDGIEAIAAEFVKSVAEDRHQHVGFPSNAYSVSKALLNAFTRVLAKELLPSQHVNSVCPGWVRTRMGGKSAPRDVEHGASGIVWAATLGDGGASGGFFRDERPIGW